VAADARGRARSCVIARAASARARLGALVQRAADRRLASRADRAARLTLARAYASIVSTISPRRSKQAATSGPPKPQPPWMVAGTGLVGTRGGARSSPRATGRSPP